MINKDETSLQIYIKPVMTTHIQMLYIINKYQKQKQIYLQQG